MSRDPVDRLLDIEEALSRVTRLTQGINLEGFLEDEAKYFAVIYSLGVVGEAVKSLPDDLKENENKVDWRAIGRLRDILFHVYFGISDSVLWQIIQESVPETLAAIRRLIEAQNAPDD